MRKPNRVLSVALLSVVAAGCASSFRTDWDADADFDSYGSFALFDRPQRPRARQREESPLVARRIERALSEQLSARGYDSAPARSSELLVTYHTAVRERVHVSQVGYGYPRRWHYGWGWGGTRVHHYREGSLIVDVIDASDRELVWRGVAEGVFTKPNPSDEKVAKVVAKLLKGFPPSSR
jgi:hypothetical protein